jgi:hypothetical protein
MILGDRAPVYIRSEGILMQQGVSESQAKPRKSSAIIAGLGAALVAAAVTFIMMTSNPSPTVQDQAAATQPQPQCGVVKREVLVSTISGSGTVRLREGSYLSPPVSLSTTPQRVVFPVDRPQTIASGEEVITIEGNATDVVLTSPLTNWRKVFEKVTGVVAFSTQWAPAKGC